MRPRRDGERLELHDPSLALRTPFLQMLRDFERHGELHRVHASDIADGFEVYLETLARWARGDGLSAGTVPWSTHWLVRDGREVLGSAVLRAGLTPELEREGGHIGYGIRPSARRQGYGTALLGLMLQLARQRGYDRVMVTCDADNVGSRKIIEANGGQPAGQAISTRTGKLVLRFWCDTPDEPAT